MIIMIVLLSAFLHFKIIKKEIYKKESFKSVLTVFEINKYLLVNITFTMENWKVACLAVLNNKYYSRLLLY